jgi:hypothetical protein
MPTGIVGTDEKRASPNDTANNKTWWDDEKFDAVGSSRNYGSDLDDETTLVRIVRQRVW